MFRWLAIVVMAACISCAEDEPAAPSQVTGVITEVSIDGEQVTGFTVEAGDTRHHILIDPRRDYGFDLRHLNEHQTSGDPVRVDLEQRDGRLYAVTIRDA